MRFINLGLFPDTCSPNLFNISSKFLHHTSLYELYEFNEPFLQPSKFALFHYIVSFKTTEVVDQKLQGTSPLTNGNNLITVKVHWKQIYNSHNITYITLL